MSLLQSPAHLPPSVALQLSQKAPNLLRKPVESSSFSVPFLSSPESPDTWTTYENLLISCLRTRDDRSAKQCLDRLIGRFGAENERVMALKGMYDEALAETDADLKRILVGYEKSLEADPSNMPIAKRRVALLRSMSKHAEAINALTLLADVSPTDAEIWTELSDLYFLQALYPQAIFSLEEALLIVPDAWNLNAHLGEILYISATQANQNSESSTKSLLASVKRFCRSVELCEGYPRGYYGLKLATSRLLSGTYKAPKAEEGEDEPASLEVINRLNAAATSKLEKLVQDSSRKSANYDPAEIIAIKELLGRES